MLSAKQGSHFTILTPLVWRGPASNLDLPIPKRTLYHWDALPLELTGPVKVTIHMKSKMTISFPGIIKVAILLASTKNKKVYATEADRPNNNGKESAEPPWNGQESMNWRA